MRRPLLIAVTITAALVAVGAPGSAVGSDQQSAPVAEHAGVPAEMPPPETDSVLLTCDQADNRVELTTSTHLDPTCEWTSGFDITASDVVLDCQGATIRSEGGGRGIKIATSIDTDLNGAVIRHCRIDGFLNSIRATRDGFRTLAPGEEYEHELADVLIEHNDLTGSRGVGVFVDGYVSRVTIRHNRIVGEGSAGIYLETGSRRNRVEANLIHDNGFVENGPEGQLTSLLGLQFRWWGAGREGVAIDGSYENEVVGNDFAGNSHGGVFLYTNCGEYPDSGVWFDRRWPADRNLIDNNTFADQLNGVWVGQRMGENTLPMECTKPAYSTGPLRSVTLDFAADNTISHNRFVNVTYGVRVEDDGTTVHANEFIGSGAGQHAVVIGTPDRTTALDQPVANTVITDNHAEIAGNANPYRWVHGYDGLFVSGNTAADTSVGICEGEPLPRLFMVWMIAAALEPIGSPPTPTPDDISHPTLGALEPCVVRERPTIRPAATVVAETADAPASIPVELSGPSDQTVTVNWATVPIDAGEPWATPAIDFVAASGVLEFEPGQTEATVEIELLDDDDPEIVEFVVVAFTEPINAELGGFWGLGFVVVLPSDLF